MQVGFTRLHVDVNVGVTRPGVRSVDVFGASQGEGPELVEVVEVGDGKAFRIAGAGHDWAPVRRWAVATDDGTSVFRRR